MSLQATLVAMDPASVPTSPPAPMQITPEQRDRTSANTLPVPSTHRGDVLTLPTHTPQGVPIYATGNLPRPSTSRSYGPSTGSDTMQTQYTDYGLPDRPATTSLIPFQSFGVPTSFGPGESFSPDKDALKQALQLEKERAAYQRQEDYLKFEQAAISYKDRFEATAENLKADFRDKAQQHIQLAQDRQDVAVATVKAQANSALDSANQQLQKLQMAATDKLQQSHTQLQNIQLLAQKEFDKQSQAHSQQVSQLEAYADQVYTTELTASKGETDKVRQEAIAYVKTLQDQQLAGKEELRYLEDSMQQLKQVITSEAQEHIRRLEANYHQSDQSQRSQTDMMRTQFMLENAQLRMDLEAANAQLQAGIDVGAAKADSQVTQLQQQLQAANLQLKQREQEVTQMERQAADHQETIAAHQAKSAQDAQERKDMKQNMEGLQRQVLQQRSATGSAANRTVSTDGGTFVHSFEIHTPRTFESEPSHAEAPQDASGDEQWEEPKYTAEEWKQWEDDSWEPEDCQICIPQGIPVCVCGDRIQSEPLQPSKTSAGIAGLSSAIANFPPTIPTLDLSAAQRLAQQLPDVSYQAKPEQSLPMLPLFKTNAPTLSPESQPPQGQPTNPQDQQGSLPANPPVAEFFDFHRGRPKEADDVRLYDIPDIAGVENWHAANRKSIMSASGRPLEANIWFNQILQAKSLADLEDGIEWQTLTYKMATDLWRKLYKRPALQRTVRSTEERLIRQGKHPLNGRQLYWMITQDLLIGPYDASLKRQWDLIHIFMRGGNLHKFQLDFKDCLLKLPPDEFPNPQFLEDIYSAQVKTHYGFYQTYQLYLLETDQQGLPKSYERLSQMVDKFLAAQHRESNTNQFRRTQSWAPGGSKGHAMTVAPQHSKPKGPPAGECPQAWYNGSCSRPNCPMTHNFKGHGKGSKGKGSKGKGKWHSQPPRVPKGKGKRKDPPRTPRQQHTPRGTPRNNSRGTSPSGNPNAAPCREWMNKGYCPKEAQQKNSCPYWHKPQCWFWKTKGEHCHLGDRCNFLHAKIYEPQNYSMRPASKTPKGTSKGKDGKGKGKDGKGKKGKDGKGKGKDGKGKKGKDGKGKGKDGKGKHPKGAPAKAKPKAKGKAAGHMHVAVSSDATAWQSDEWQDDTGTWQEQGWDTEGWQDDTVQPLNQQGC